MFEHSVKVPRLYKSAAKIAQEVKEKNGSLKKLVFEQKHLVSNFEVTFETCLFLVIYISCNFQIISYLYLCT